MTTNKKTKKHRVYTVEFKKEAVTLAAEIGASAASRKLGIPLTNIDKWKNGQAMNRAQSPELKQVLEENRKLKHRLAQSEAVNEILKKTAAIFSKGYLK